VQKFALFDAELFLALLRSCFLDLATNVGPECHLIVKI